MADSSQRYTDSDPTSDAWDALDPVPEAGAHELVDRLCAAKHIEPNDLVRVGARFAEQSSALAFRYGEVVRYRDLIAGRMWTYPAGGQYAELKLVPQGPQPTDIVIVCEGETDAARLSAAYPCDVAIMPAGAETVKPAYVDQLRDYERVLVGLDHDRNGAGDRGAAKWMRALDQAERWSPAPDNDWCAKDDLPALPVPPKPPPLLVWGAELFGLEIPEVPSYLEGGLLPMTGMLLLHGWKSSFKSWLTFDLMVALAEGGRWAEFETTMPQTKVGIVQFEVRPPGYTQRMEQLRSQMDTPELFSNIAHFSPVKSPEFVVGNSKMEAKVYDTLLQAGCHVVLFDPVRQMVGARSMNEEEVQQQLNQFFRRFNQEGVAVVFTHHDAKAPSRQGGGSNLDMTAGAVLAGTADTIVSVGLPKDDDMMESTRRNLRFTVRDGPTPTPRRFELTDDVRLEYGLGSWEVAGGEGDPGV